MLTGNVKVPGPVWAEAEMASGGTMFSSARWGLTGFVPSPAVVGLCFRLQAQKHRDKTANMNASLRRQTATRDRLIRTLHLSALTLRADLPMSLPARSQ